MHEAADVHDWHDDHEENQNGVDNVRKEAKRDDEDAPGCQAEVSI